MPAQPIQSSTTLQLSRTFNAPRERVFRAWTEPEALKKWFGPGDYVTPHVEMDFRVGGKFRILLGVPYLHGVFREIIPPERLVFTHRFEGGEEEQQGETQVTVEFFDRDGATELVLTHEGIPLDKRPSREDLEWGWSSALDSLQELFD